MHERLRPSGIFLYSPPPSPPKIKPQLTTENFKRFVPKTIGPQPVAKIRKIVQSQSIQNVPLIRPTARVISSPRPLAPSPKQSSPVRQITQIQVNRTPAIRHKTILPATRLKTVLPAIQQTNITKLRGLGTGRTLIMIGAGPSINEVDFSPLLNRPLIDFMCINQPHKPVWPARFWAFCDHTQYRRNLQTWDKYDGIIINSTNVSARKSNQLVVSVKPGKGFSQDLANGYHLGRSSTYANMQTAAYMGYEQVYIFGVDMTEVNGKLHYYGQNPDVSNEVRKKRFSDEAVHYLWAGTHLPAGLRSRFVFCSSYNPWPFLTYFTKWDHTTAVADILKGIDQR